MWKPDWTHFFFVFAQDLDWVARLNFTFWLTNLFFIGQKTFNPAENDEMKFKLST